MPRPPQAVKKATLTVQIAPDLLAQMDLLLYSELEGRVPYGAREKVLTPLIERWVKERQHAEAVAFAERQREWRAEQEAEARAKQLQGE